MQLGPLLAKRLDLAYEMRLKGYEPITPHLVGPAGIGKSMFLAQWAARKAKQLGLEFVDADKVNPEDVERYLEKAKSTSSSRTAASQGWTQSTFQASPGRSARSTLPSCRSQLRGS